MQVLRGSQVKLCFLKHPQKELHNSERTKEINQEKGTGYEVLHEGFWKLIFNGGNRSFEPYLIS